MITENQFVDNHEVLKEETFELDSTVGHLLIKLEALKNMNVELGHVSEDIENTDTMSLTAMGLTFYDIDHKVQIVADLLNYTVQDLNEIYEKASLIRDSYYDLIVRTEVEKEE